MKRIHTRIQSVLAASTLHCSPGLAVQECRIASKARRCRMHGKFGRSSQDRKVGERLAAASPIGRASDDNQVWIAGGSYDCLDVRPINTPALDKLRVKGARELAGIVPLDGRGQRH